MIGIYTSKRSNKYVNEFLFYNSTVKDSYPTVVEHESMYSNRNINDFILVDNI